MPVYMTMIFMTIEMLVIVGATSICIAASVAAALAVCGQLLLVAEGRLLGYR